MHFHYGLFFVYAKKYILSISHILKLMNIDKELQGIEVCESVCVRMRA